MQTRIIIDSTADLIPELKACTAVVPLTVHFGEEEYTDGVTITHQQFYEKLVETDVLPRTSQASPAAFAKVYKAAVTEGQQAVVLTVSEKLSGTYQSAMIAAEEFGGKGKGSTGSVKSKKAPMHGFENSISLDLPGLSVIYLKAPVSRKRKTTNENAAKNATK